MTRRVYSFLFAAVCSGSLAFGANCEALSGLKLADTTISVAKSVATEKGVPAHCLVHGLIKPAPVSAIQFEVWLPEAGWNGKLQTVGNGGLAGTISFPAMGTALKAGFATASTDTGHTAEEPKDWLQNKERMIDYSYRGLHLTTVDAKAIVDAYYGQNASEALYTGCSTGGKQGLMEAQRFPADFDAIVAGDAANYWTRQMVSEVWNGVATGTPETALPEAKLQLVQDAVLEQCDALDGVKDGLIADPRRCKFDPKKLLCKGGDAASCLTAGQLSAVQKIYSGPVNPRTGQSVYPGPYPGGELGWGGARPMVINRPGKSSGVSSWDFMRFSLFSNPEWDFHSFDFDRELQTLEEKYAALTNATDANLEEFRKLGHKLIYYHGASDPLIPAQNGVNYYESVVAQQKGLDKTQTFFRAFLVPGLYHCAGGPGANGFGTAQPAPAGQVDADHDVVQAAVRWVEKGVAPAKIIATRYVDGAPAKGVQFQRPLCPYPLAARYNGKGDTNDAANFSCVK
jgi:hypothetical protein